MVSRILQVGLLLLIVSPLVFAAGFQKIEEQIFNGFLDAVSDPIYLALLVLGFFLGFTIMQGGRLDVVVLAMVPAFILAASYHPAVPLLGGLLFSVILYLAIMRLQNK